MNVIFMGTPSFAIPTLKSLIQSENHNVVAVVSQPDKPKGRGKKMLPTSIKEFAMENGINNIFQPTTLKDPDFINQLKSLNADIFVVVAYGKILPEEIFNMPKFKTINVHASLLPKYRGAGPIQWAIINGETKTGVTIMYIEKSLDTGDMILSKEIPINKDDTFNIVHDKLADVGAQALIEALDIINTGEFVAQKQNDDLATYAPLITKETRLINWNDTSENIINLIRGLNPVPCAYTNYKDSFFKIFSAKEVDGYNGKIGEIVDVIKDGFVVKTLNSALLITEIQAKDGKRMLTSEFLKGHNIEKNIILN